MQRSADPQACGCWAMHTMHGTGALGMITIPNKTLGLPLTCAGRRGQAGHRAQNLCHRGARHGDDLWEAVSRSLPWRLASNCGSERGNLHYQQAAAAHLTQAVLKHRPKVILAAAAGVWCRRQAAPTGACLRGRSAGRAGAQLVACPTRLSFAVIAGRTAWFYFVLHAAVQVCICLDHSWRQCCAALTCCWRMCCWTRRCRWQIFTAWPSTASPAQSSCCWLAATICPSLQTVSTRPPVCNPCADPAGCLAAFLGCQPTAAQLPPSIANSAGFQEQAGAGALAAGFNQPSWRLPDALQNTAAPAE